MKGDFVDAAEPWAIFRAWMEEAEAADLGAFAEFLLQRNHVVDSESGSLG